MLAVALLDSTVKVFFADSLRFFLSLYGHRLPGGTHALLFNVFSATNCPVSDIVDAVKGLSSLRRVSTHQLHRLSHVVSRAPLTVLQTRPGDTRLHVRTIVECLVREARREPLMCDVQCLRWTRAATGLCLSRAPPTRTSRSGGSTSETATSRSLRTRTLSWPSHSCQTRTMSSQQVRGVRRVCGWMCGGEADA